MVLLRPLDKFQNKALFFLGAALILLNYCRPLWNTALGDDMQLRIAESRYFFHGIDPYKVLIGRVPRIDAFGDPNAYPVWSYFYAGVFWVGESFLPPRVLFIVVDLFSVFCSVFLVASATGALTRERMYRYWPAVLMLAVSVWLGQQVITLNYNCQVLLFLALVFYGVAADKPALSVVGATLLAIKPSFALPVYLYLAVARRWRIAGWTAGILIASLFAASAMLDESPIRLLVETWQTQQLYGDLQTGGVLTFLQPLLGSEYSALSATIGLLALVLILGRTRRDPWLSCVACICVSLSFFYNRMYAYTVTFLILVIGITFLRAERLVALLALGFVFLDVPRFYSVFHFDGYLMTQNTLRCALLFAALWILARTPRAVIPWERAECRDLASPHCGLPQAPGT